MRPKSYEITVEKALAASPEEVYRTFREPAAYCAVHGCHEARIDLRPGGRIEVVFREGRPHGETFVVQEAEEPHRLVFAWEGEEDHPVTVRLQRIADGTRLAITQHCGGNPGWIENCLDGWAWIADSLETYLTTGQGLDHGEWAREFGTHRVVRRE